MSEDKIYTERFEPYLPTGKENAVNRFELAEMTGYGKSLRVMRRDIHKARKEGLPILSRSDSKGGYYLPENRQEIIDFVRSMKRRGVSTLAAIKESNRMLKTDEFQIDIKDLIKESED